MIPSQLEVRRPPVPPFRASKWLGCSLLIDQHEMKQLLESCGICQLFNVSGICEKGKGEILQKDFLDFYGLYIEALKRGELLEDPRVRIYFNAAATVSLEAVYALEINEHEQFIKVDKPVVQLRQQTLGYSAAEKKLREMTFGPNSIQWGIQFSYPQLYQNESDTVIEVKKEPLLSNTSFFENIQKWARKMTVPTPFLIEGHRINSPLRLGKNCFSWINNHPQLKSQRIQIEI